MRNTFSKKVLFLVLISFFATVFSFSQAKWTIMVYLDGDNDLEKYAINDFLEMASIGSNSLVNIVVQFDRTPGFDTRYGNWTNTQRFKVTQGMEPVVSSAVQDWGDGFGGRETNSGDPETLKDFVLWAKNTFPAEHYALILWDHGDGWRSMDSTVQEIENTLKKSDLSQQERYNLKKFAEQLKRKIYSRRYLKSICFDNTSGDELTIKEVRQALSDEGCFVDIVAFDACLMGMIEIGYEIRNCCRIMIASEEAIEVSGFPYDSILSEIIQNPEMTPIEFASTIVQKYGEYYGAFGTNTLSAIDLSLMNLLYSSIENACNTAINLNNQWIYFYLAMQSTRKYDDVDYKDFKDFILFSANNVSNQDLAEQLNDIISVVNSMIIANYGYGNGLSIYLPEKQNGIDTNYNSENLEFASGIWKEFLKNLFSSDITCGFSILLYENFSDGMPDDWTIIDGNNDGKTWTTSNPGDRYIQEMENPFAIVDSDWAGRIWMNEQLITKTIKVDGSKKIFLTQKQFFNSYGSEIASIDISVDDGPWQNIARYQYQDVRGESIFLLNPYINTNNIAQIKIRWNYQNAFDAFYWAIDDIYILQEGITKGDISKDGLLDVSDVILCLRMAISLDPVDLETADMNNDGIVDISDVILILRKAIGLD